MMEVRIAYGQIGTPGLNTCGEDVPNGGVGKVIVVDCVGIETVAWPTGVVGHSCLDNIPSYDVPYPLRQGRVVEA